MNNQYQYVDQLAETFTNRYLMDKDTAIECAYRVCENVTVKCDPPPIPDRRHDFQWVHNDYDGENGLCGSASNYIGCLIEAFEVCYA